jgi:diguanylate cyclase
MSMAPLALLDRLRGNGAMPRPPPGARRRLILPTLGSLLSRLTRSTSPSAKGDVAMGDVSELLGAVKWRLRQIVGERPATDSSLPEAEERKRVRLEVLDCVTALDQLHATLQHTLGRHRLLERQVLDAQSALVRARSGLTSEQTDERHSTHPSLRDNLTRLPNRQCFHERLDRALAAAWPPGAMLALLYVDLDGFRPLDATRGHDAGDDVLEIAAVRLGRALRADDLVARMDGDQFACLLTGTFDRDQLSRLACKLFDTLSVPLRIGALRLTVSPSIGIVTSAVGAAGQTDANSVLRRAASAMARAKRQHSGYAFDTQPGA